MQVAGSLHPGRGNSHVMCAAQGSFSTTQWLVIFWDATHICSIEQPSSCGSPSHGQPCHLWSSEIIGLWSRSAAELCSGLTCTTTSCQVVAHVAWFMAVHECAALNQRDIEGQAGTCIVSHAMATRTVLSQHCTRVRAGQPVCKRH